MKPSDDHMIPESTIIIEYLDGHYPNGTRLIPAGTDEARKVRFMDRMADLYLNDPATTLMFQKFGFRQSSEDELARAAKYVRLSYENFDKRLANQDWLCGEFSMADCAAIPSLFYCKGIAPFSDYRNIVSYYERAAASQRRQGHGRVRADLGKHAGAARKSISALLRIGEPPVHALARHEDLRYDEACADFILLAGARVVPLIHGA